MFERFTERSRRVVVLAQQESRALDHTYIGTEHILLGLIREGDGIAARVIASAGLTLEAARAEVAAMIGRGNSAPSGHIPFTPRAKKVLELALREALTLNKSYIGPEHILLGLIREADGVGAQILARFAFPLPDLRAEVIELAAAEPSEPIDPEQSEPLLATEWVAAASPDGLGAGFVSGRRRVVASARGPVLAEFRETLASLGETLASLDRRLAAIERQLGIAEAADEAPGTVAGAVAEDAAPEDATPEESAE